MTLYDVFDIVDYLSFEYLCVEGTKTLYLLMQSNHQWKQMIKTRFQFHWERLAIYFLYRSRISLPLTDKYLISLRNRNGRRIHDCLSRFMNMTVVEMSLNFEDESKNEFARDPVPYLLENFESKKPEITDDLEYNSIKSPVTLDKIFQQFYKSEKKRKTNQDTYIVLFRKLSDDLEKYFSHFCSGTVHMFCRIFAAYLTCQVRFSNSYYYMVWNHDSRLQEHIKYQNKNIEMFINRFAMLCVSFSDKIGLAIILNDLIANVPKTVDDLHRFHRGCFELHVHMMSSKRNRWRPYYVTPEDLF